MDHSVVSLEHFTSALNRQSEAWRYSPLHFFKNKKYSMQTDLSRATFNVGDIKKNDAYNLIFVNGRLQFEHSDIEALQQLKNQPVEIKTCQNKTSYQDCPPPADWQKEEFRLALANEALWSESVILRIKSENILPRPLHVVQIFLDGSNNETNLSFPRLFIFAGKNSRCDVFETLVGASSALPVVNKSFHIEAGAQFNWIQCERESLSIVENWQAQVEQDASLRFLTLTQGGEFNRRSIQVYLQKSGASVELNALCLLEQNQNSDFQTQIEHVSGHTQSRQLHKAILAKKSTLNFNGMIHIHPYAQKSSAQQLNKNIVLDPSATVNARPQLKILADDVKAAHGATIGQLNPDEIFYFESRGISKDVATQMLMHGFMFDLVSKVENSQIVSWLAESLQKMGRF